MQRVIKTVKEDVYEQLAREREDDVLTLLAAWQRIKRERTLRKGCDNIKP